MKRTLSMLIAAIVLLSGFCFYASADNSDTEFVFRDGINWWMTPKEVLKLEKEGNPTQAELNEGYPIVYCDPVTVSKFSDCSLMYIFGDGGLFSIAYIFNEVNIDSVDSATSYLSSALSQKYRKVSEVPMKELFPVINEILIALMEEPLDEEEMNDVDYSDLAWELDDGTMIFIDNSEGELVLFYVAPRLQGEYNDNGL